MCGQGAGSYARWSARLCLPTVIFLIRPYTCASQTCAPRACLIERGLNQLYWLRQPRHDSVEIYHAVIVNTVTFYLGTPAPLMEMGGWTAFHVIRKTWYGNDLRASLEPGAWRIQQRAARRRRRSLSFEPVGGLDLRSQSCHAEHTAPQLNYSLLFRPFLFFPTTSFEVYMQRQLADIKSSQH